MLLQRPPKSCSEFFLLSLLVRSRAEREHQMVPRDKGTTLHLNDFQNKQKTEIEEKKM